jgi:hypothetical protein
MWPLRSKITMSSKPFTYWPSLNSDDTCRATMTLVSLRSKRSFQRFQSLPE